MPIKIPNSLPATKVLDRENIFVMTEYRALHQDIRPLHIVILNLMPTKIVTETQLLRLLSNSALQLDIEFIQASTHKSKNTSADHLISFYKTFDDIKHRKFDGMIITGAPVENIPYDEVNYWEELKTIMEWSKANVFSTLHICWGAQAALYYHYGIEKHPLSKKMFGIFEHDVLDMKNPLVRGFDQRFNAPHSRHTAVCREDIEKNGELTLLCHSDEAGVYACVSNDGREVFVMGHCEYDAETLAMEYFRDIDKGLEIEMPKNYFPNNNPENTPINTWRAHGSLLFSNWLNYYVYQTTPYDLQDIGGVKYSCDAFTVGK